LFFIKSDTWIDIKKDLPRALAMPVRTTAFCTALTLFLCSGLTNTTSRICQSVQTSTYQQHLHYIVCSDRALFNIVIQELNYCNFRTLHPFAITSSLYLSQYLNSIYYGLCFMTEPDVIYV